MKWRSVFDAAIRLSGYLNRSEESLTKLPLRIRWCLALEGGREACKSQTQHPTASCDSNLFPRQLSGACVCMVAAWLFLLTASGQCLALAIDKNKTTTKNHLSVCLLLFVPASHLCQAFFLLRVVGFKRSYTACI